MCVSRLAALHPSLSLHAESDSDREPGGGSNSERSCRTQHIHCTVYLTHAESGRVGGESNSESVRDVKDELIANTPSQTPHTTGLS